MIKRFFTKNLSIKLLALVSATVFWFFVLSSVNTFFAFPDRLQIDAFNTPEGLAVVNNLGMATITVRADQEVYKTLTPDNFTVYADLQGLAAGTKRVDISVNSKKPEVSVVSINPGSVEVVLEELTTKQVPVVFELEGEPEENYVASLTEEDQTVVLSGAQSVLDGVYEAVAVFSLNGDEIGTTTRSLDIEVLDDDGQALSHVMVEPRTISATAEIFLEQSQKTVGIRVNVGSIENGWVSSLISFPKVVQIQGDAEILEEINYLETETITIPNGRTFYEITIPLILPDDITLAQEEDPSIEVTLVISPNE